MIEKNQLKKEGLAFGRNLQRAFRLVFLFSADHATAEEPLQRTYAALNSLLKQSPQFTFGFFNRQIVLNDLLVPDSSLEALDTEFFKRGISGVSFVSGVTFREFKRGLGLLTTKPEAIEQNGGIAAFLRKNPVEGMRILPAERRPGLTGDSVLGMDSQSYMMAQSILEPQQGSRTPSLELLLQSAGLASPERFRGTPAEMLDLVGKATQAAWSNPEGDPRQTIQAVARLLEELTPNFLISALPPGRQAELQGRPSQEVASELAEDMAIEWAKKRLAAAAKQPEAKAVEQEVLRVMGRALRTTQVAERLLQKLGRLVNSAELPAEVTERIRQEMLWSSWTLEEKHAYLMGLNKFAGQNFRHLLEYIREVSQEGNLETATQVADRFLGCLNSEPPETRAEGLSWLPELIRLLTGLNTLEFVRTTADRLCKELAEAQGPDGQVHLQAANCLATAAQSLSLFEDFVTVLKIGSELERSLAKDKERHAECCGSALKNLLPPAAVQRLIELSLQKRPDPKKSDRILASVLRLVEAQAAETVFRLLEDERTSSGRGRLLHIVRQLGQGAFEAARKRLQDERWYVVRNACYVLGALGDPHLGAQLGPALRHPDARVQEAAVTAIIKSNVPGRGEILVKALPGLQPHLQETVLNELVLLKDPTAISPLEEFLLAGTTTKTGTLEKALQALVAIPGERVVEVLGKILRGTGNPLPLRRAALAALKASVFPSARQQLADFSLQAPGDPLAKL